MLSCITEAAKAEAASGARSRASRHAAHMPSQSILVLLATQEPANTTSEGCLPHSVVQVEFGH